MDSDREIILRDVEDADRTLFGAAFAHIDDSTYASYYKEVCSNKCDLIIAFDNEELVGYGKLDWQDEAVEEEIPVIKNLHVKSGYRGRGIGSKLMKELEKRASKKSAYCAIGVGLSEAYEAAQHLLQKRGYAPDGNGIFYIETGFIEGELEVDDNQALMMIKKLRA